MGKFDGYLICSDLDGTFWGKGAEVENQKAVEYFIQNGGRFSFATGRTVEFIREQPFFPCINAPACLLNGGIVYDYENGWILREKRVGFTVREFLEAIEPQKATVARLCVHRNAFDPHTAYADLGAVEPCDLRAHAVKLICVFETPEKAQEFKKFATEQKFFKSTYISRSWGVGVEFNAADGTKGHALDFIKEYLKDIHTSVGIGDYENDIPLISHADIGAAVGSGVDGVKAVADWVVKPCAEFAVKDLIERLEVRLASLSEGGGTAVP